MFPYGDPMSTASPHADHSVRPAQPEDADVIGRIQVRCARATHRSALTDEVVDGFDPERFSAAWLEAMRQHGPRAHLLVACDGPAVVGFAAIAPSTDPDADDRCAELTVLYVDPDRQRTGHGSRLLAAATDVAGTDVDDVRHWVMPDDPARERFLSEAGFQPDGAWREFEVVPGHTVAERRWTTTLR